MLLTFSMLAVVAGLLDPLPSIPDLVAKLHTPRAGITRYELIIDARDGEGAEAKHLHHLWHDIDRHRADRLNDFGAGDIARRSIDCTNCPRPGEFFVVDYDPVFDASKLAKLAPSSQRTVLIAKTQFPLADLGATEETAVNLVSRNLQWGIDLPVWTVRRVEICVWEKLPAYKIVLEAPNHESKSRFEVTLVPERDYAAVRAASSWVIGGQETVTVSESKLIRAHGMWLPASSEYTQHIGGKRAARLHQKFEYVSINQPIDPKVFTLEGMDLITGTLVSTESGILNWDGARLGPAAQVVYLPPQFEGRADEPRRGASRRLWLLVAAGAAVLACAASVWRLVVVLRRRVRHEPRPGL